MSNLKWSDKEISKIYSLDIPSLDEFLANDPKVIWSSEEDSQLPFILIQYIRKYTVLILNKNFNFLMPNLENLCKNIITSLVENKSKIDNNVGSPYQNLNIICWYTISLLEEYENCKTSFRRINQGFKHRQS